MALRSRWQPTVHRTMQHLMEYIVLLRSAGSKQALDLLSFGYPVSKLPYATMRCAAVLMPLQRTGGASILATWHQWKFEPDLFGRRSTGFRRWGAVSKLGAF